MILLMATLFWALWDEGVGQRPWKAFQQEWKDRYGAFLKTAKSSSAQSEKEIEQSPEYQKLAQTQRKPKPLPPAPGRNSETDYRLQRADSVGPECFYRPPRLRQRA